MIANALSVLVPLTSYHLADQCQHTNKITRWIGIAVCVSVYKSNRWLNYGTTVDIHRHTSTQTHTKWKVIQTLASHFRNIIFEAQQSIYQFWSLNIFVCVCQTPLAHFQGHGLSVSPEIWPCACWFFFLFLFAGSFFLVFVQLSFLTFSHTILGREFHLSLGLCDARALAIIIFFFVCSCLFVDCGMWQIWIVSKWMCAGAKEIVDRVALFSAVSVITLFQPLCILFVFVSCVFFRVFHSLSCLCSILFGFLLLAVCDVVGRQRGLVS